MRDDFLGLVSRQPHERLVFRKLRCGHTVSAIPRLDPELALLVTAFVGSQDDSQQNERL